MGEDRACVTVVAETKTYRLFEHAGGRPTGLACDGDDQLWVAGGPANSLVRINAEGDILSRIDGCGSEPFLFPNDLAFGANGLLYLTDSGMRPEELISGLVIRPDFATAPYRGRVFEIDPRLGSVTRMITDDLVFANGICFGPDEAIYYNETLTGRIFRQEIDARPELYAQVSTYRPTDRFRGPDGMAFDENGHLYCAIYGEGRIAVIGPGGTILPSLPTNGKFPTNVAFRRSDQAMLVTEVEHGAVEIIPAPALGLPLHCPALL